MAENNNIPDIRKMYDRDKTPREAYLNDAEEVAKLFAPSIAPRGRVIQERPFTHRGQQAAMSLSSTSAKTFFPGGVQYFQMDLAKWAWTRMGASLAQAGMSQEKIFKIVEFLVMRMRQRTIDVIQSLEQKHVRSRFATLSHRNLIEGTTGIHNAVDSIRTFPLRSIVTKRHSGQLYHSIFCESMEEDDDGTGYDENVTGAEKKEQKEPPKLYTLVRHPIVNPADPTGELLQKPGIWKQKSGEKATPYDKETWRQYFTMVSEQPDVEDYPHGYAFHFLRLVSQIDHTQAGLGAAIATAAFNVPLFKDGSAMADQVNRVGDWKAGEPKIGDQDDVGWFTANLDLGKWAFALGLLGTLNDELSSGFAMGIKDRPISADTSATAIIEIKDELSAQLHRLLLSLEETGVKNLILSEIDIFEQFDPIIPGGYVDLTDFVEVRITTGNEALERQRSLLKMVQAAPILSQLDQRLEWNGKEFADRMSESMLIRNDNLYRQRTAEEMQAIMQAQIAALPGAKPPQEDPQTMMTRGGPQRSNNPQPAGMA